MTESEIPKRGLSLEDARYAHALEELVHRLAVHAATSEAGRKLLLRLKREVVEAAFREIPQSSAPGMALDQLSDFLSAACRATREQCEDLERRFRGRDNLGLGR